MTQSKNPAQELQERTGMAFHTAILDTALLDSLERYGYDRNSVTQLCVDLSNSMKEGQMTCAAIRNELRRAFPKSRSKQARDLVIRYRTEMHDWVNGASPHPHPPNLSIQRLPAMTSQTLNRYFSLYERFARDALRHTPPDTNVAREEIGASNNLYEQCRYDIESAGPPGVTKLIEIDLPADNIRNALNEYINQSEENALEVLVYIMSIDDADQFGIYRTHMQTAISRLSGNVHFLRSLFNLIDENAYSDNPIHIVPGEALQELLNSLNATGVTTPFEENDIAVQIHEPRDYHYHTQTFIDAYTGEQTDVNNEIPSRYLPPYWNGARLVNPNLNVSFQEFANILERDASANMDNKMGEVEHYIHELEQSRRYALSFSRVKVTEIPGTEDMDIWFNYSHDEEMNPHEMRVEVVVNDAGIVYHLNGAQFGMRDNGNIVPRIAATDDTSNNLDRLYGSPHVQNWASRNSQENLAYYILRYAHALLVLPRTTRARSQNPSPDNPDNPFNLRLGEHSTTTYMPSGSTNGEGPSGYTITAYHGVTGHVRNLPPGHQASPEAIAEAERHHVRLTGNQTWVREHTRGSELTEQGKDGRGIETE